MVKFGIKLRAARDERQIGMRELARMLEISSTYLLEVERGSRPPFNERTSPGIFERVADRVGGSADEWREMARVERNAPDVGGLPAEVGDLIVDIYVAAMTLKRGQVLLARDALGLPEK